MLSRTVLEALNQRASENRRLVNITDWSKITTFYPQADGKQFLPKAVTMSQHEELTLALFITEKSLKKKRIGPVRLGVFKPCCIWCQYYLEELNSLHGGRGLSFLYKGSHGKQPAGRLQPQGTEPLIAYHMKTFIVDKIDQVFIRVGGRRSMSTECVELELGLGDHLVDPTVWAPVTWSSMSMVVQSRIGKSATLKMQLFYISTVSDNWKSLYFEHGSLLSVLIRQNYLTAAIEMLRSSRLQGAEVRKNLLRFELVN